MMGSFRAIKKISLAGVGEGWDDKCFIKFYAYSLADFKSIVKAFKETDGKESLELADEVIKVHKSLFHSGMGLDADSNEVIAITAEDVPEILCLPGVLDKIREVLLRGNARLKEQES